MSLHRNEENVKQDDSIILLTVCINHQHIAIIGELKTIEIFK